MTNEKTDLITELKSIVSENDAETILSTNPSIEALRVIVECLQQKSFNDLNSEWNARLGQV